MQKTHVLVWPISQEGQGDVVEVVISTLTSKQNADIVAKGLDIPDQNFEIILASSNVSEEQLLEMKNPDLNSLYAYVEAFMDPDQLKDTLFKDIKDEAPALLEPIKGDDGRDITTYDIKPPSVRISKLMREKKTEFEQLVFVVGNCTGLSEQEVHRLRVPDWIYMKNRVQNFLHKPGDFFRKTM